MKLIGKIYQLDKFKDKWITNRTEFLVWDIHNQPEPIEIDFREQFHFKYPNVFDEKSEQ